MVSTARGTGKNIRSTDRGGVVSLAAGILCLALGFGMQIGITLQASSRTVVALKEMALGMGGVLYPLVPLFCFWLGWLLCVSARHYISFRAFAVSFAAFLALLALLTMLTTVAGFGTLMQYIRNMNLNILKVAEPDTWGEYMARAYQRYSNQLNPLPGGGALGMLVAFPVWRVLGQVGGVIFLIVVLIALFFTLFRINPVLLVQRLDNKIQGRGESVRNQAAAAGPAPQDVPQPEPRTAEQESVPAYQPSVTPYYVEPYQPVSVTQDPYQPAYTAQENGWQATPVTERPEDEGFTAVTQDVFEQFEQTPPPTPIRVPRKTRQNAVESAPISQPVQPMEPQPIVNTPAEQPERMSVATTPSAQEDKQKAHEEVPVATQRVPAYHEAVPIEPIVERPKPVAPSDDWEEPSPTPVPQPPRRPVASGMVRDVGTAPAVALTGKRVAVSPGGSSPSTQNSLDGMARTKAASKQMSMPIDSYERPPARLMSVPPPDEQADTTEEDLARADKLISTLSSFNIAATVQQIVHGPAITRFAIRLAEGVNVNRLRNVMDNIAVELLAKSAIRAEIPIPGTPLIGIEVSNDKATTVHLSEVLLSPKMQELKSPTAVALGKDITGAPVICELMDMPHLLIAGATGSGKSVCINSIITSLLYRATPTDVRMILIDPKFVELQPYNDIPHLLLPVVVDPKKAVMALEWVCQEMDERYQKLQKYGVRNIDAYNKKIDPDEEPMPKIVVVVDEMSDLMASAGKIIDEHVKRITAKARAAGICLILATQRPSVDVITGIIKANIPSRIAFQVSSQVDSRTIIDSQGAEKLLGYGDMLYLPRNLSAPKRVQGCFISDKDVGMVADYVKSRNQADYNVDIMEHIEKGDKPDGGGTTSGDAAGDVDEFDELLPKAIEMAVEAGQMSISMLQRVLRVGYGRAGRLIDEMARRNIISGNEGTKPRKTLITREEYQQLFDDDMPFD